MALATSQVTVDTTVGGVQIAPNRPGRIATTIINEGTTDVRVGGQGLTVNTGALLTGTKGASVTIPGGAHPIYGIVGGGSQLVSVIETY